MSADRIWTVVRFPNGSWSYGGKPDSPDYEHCEVWQIEAATAKDAVKKAQAKRSRQRRNAGVLVCAVCAGTVKAGKCDTCGRVNPPTHVENDDAAGVEENGNG